MSSSGQTFLGAQLKCAAASPLNPIAIGKCVATATGVSSTCGTCFGKDSLCARHNCYNQCSQDPHGKDCSICRCELCAPSLVTCAEVKSSELPEATATWPCMPAAAPTPADLPSGNSVSKTVGYVVGGVGSVGLIAGAAAFMILRRRKQQRLETGITESQDLTFYNKIT